MVDFVVLMLVLFDGLCCMLYVSGFFKMILFLLCVGYVVVDVVIMCEFVCIKMVVVFILLEIMECIVYVFVMCFVYVEYVVWLIV